MRHLRALTFNLVVAAVSVVPVTIEPDRSPNALHRSPEELMRITGKEIRARSLEGESNSQHTQVQWTFFPFKNCYEGVGATSVTDMKIEHRKAKPTHGAPRIPMLALLALNDLTASIPLPSSSLRSVDMPVTHSAARTAGICN